MSDHIAILKERLAKCEAKVLRHKKALESAENELSDIRTTLRVLGEISGESPSDVRGQAAGSTANRQQEIAGILAVGRDFGQSPIDLYEEYKRLGTDEINLDTFRTTIWRMKGRSYIVEATEYVVNSDGGRYWKEPASGAESQSQPVNFGTFDDDDSEIPF